MTVSVRMDPLLERELTAAAKRLGKTKSQFIIDAVERALGRKDPALLYRKAMEEAARSDIADGVPDEALSPAKVAVRKSLRGEYERQQDEYAAYLTQRDAAAAGKPA
jgi:RHH-type rel operon transcriptional repressor/antitoxin RelB